MHIDRIDLILVRLPLIRTFRTSSSTKAHIDHVLVRVEAGGVEGWGESASPSDPYYCPETTETCWHLLKDFLAPAVLGKEWASIDDFARSYNKVKGNNFAKSGLEMAAWDALGKAEGKSVFDLLGGSTTRIESGVSLGIEDDLPTLLRLVEQYAGEGYRRIKLKIAPGWDVDVVREVRRHFPELPLQVDANSAYTLADLDHLKRLDEFGLILIEQPLAHDDIIDHATLQAALTTPVCLDESIHSAEDARKAIDLGACRVINIKVSRVGGPREAKRVHDVCLARGVPVCAAGCTSSASAARRTWRSRPCRVSDFPETSPARTSIIGKTSSSRRCWRPTVPSTSPAAQDWAWRRSANGSTGTRSDR